MAIDFIDGFDHYANVNHLTRKGWVRPQLTNEFFVGSSGRRGSGAVGVTTLGGTISRQLTRNVTASNRYCVGFAMHLPTGSGTGYFCYLTDGTTSQCGLFLQSDRRITFARGTTGLGTSTVFVPEGAFFHIELLVVIHGSTGSYEVRLNGTNILSASGVNTQASGAAQATQLGLVGRPETQNSGLGRQWSADDFVIQSGAGADFLGDSRVDTFLPNADGASSQFTPSTGADNFAMVDEAAPDDDTTYVESATVGHRDTYGFPNLLHTPVAIHAVQVTPTARHVDTGARSLATVIRSGVTNYDGGAQVIGAEYLAYPEVWEQDPDTAAAWGVAGVNAAEYGQKVEA